MLTEYCFYTQHYYQQALNRYAVIMRW